MASTSKTGCRLQNNGVNCQNLGVDFQTVTSTSKPWRRLPNQADFASPDGGVHLKDVMLSVEVGSAKGHGERFRKVMEYVVVVEIARARTRACEDGLSLNHSE